MVLENLESVTDYEGALADEEHSAGGVAGVADAVPGDVLRCTVPGRKAANKKNIESCLCERSLT